MQEAADTGPVASLSERKYNFKIGNPQNTALALCANYMAKRQCRKPESCTMRTDI